jgi:predicted short-subunit dehydrogenase-like oxidoreductase (DUF2520 family)
VGETIAIAGAGRVGQALGRLLQERGCRVAALASRSAGHATEAARFVGGGAQAVTYGELPRYARRILIAVPDDAIGEICGVLAEAGMHCGAALHTCGARGPEAAARLAAAGVSCGTLHPLQTVATPAEGVRSLMGAAFAMDGEGEAATWAEEIASLLGGHLLRIPASARPVYHAAAVMAGNYLIVLLGAAVMLMKEAGVEEAAALRALAPLAQTSLENGLRLGPVAALTGPIRRGDAETLAIHLAALEKLPAAVADLYRAGGLGALALARLGGLPEAPARRIEEMLRKGKPDA